MYIVSDFINKKPLIKHSQVHKKKNTSMFFILKFVLIILLNETYANIMQDIETILLPALNLTSTEKIPLTFKVFGKQIQLNLRRNDQIISSMFKVWKHDAKSITEELSQLEALDCYYFHKDHISTAAINFCQEHEWEGFIFLKNDTLEIRPVRNDFASLSSINDLCVKEEVNISFGKPHLIKRSLQLSADLSFHNLDNFKLKRRHVQNTQKTLTIELAVFFDEAAYRTFMTFLSNNKQVLFMLILAYVNNIQAVFHHPSLGIPIDISLIYVEIMEKQPINLPVSNDSNTLLDSFCKYAETRNPSNDNDPHHWDVGLYLTGHIIEGLGVAKMNGVCKSHKSCAIAEFGIKEHLTSGFSSSLTAAHEIGHVLGMQHNNKYSIPCDTYKYIMSPVRFHHDQMTWSTCSRDIAKKLWDTKKCLRDRTRSKNFVHAYDHSYYHELPGREWTAKAQCEIFFRDKDANVVSLLDICKTLQCETPHKKKYYFTGPALEGTPCALGKECRGGECVPVLEPPYIFKYCEDDNWSEWTEGTCQSSCLEKSKGVRVRRRSCKHGSHRTTSCEGSYYDIVLCNDSMFCTENRTTISQFATAKCIEYNKVVRNITFDKNRKSIQLKKQRNKVIHNFKKPWKACTIHCQRKNSLFVYNPRKKMISFDIDPYFPDGTWCQNKGGQNYYCRQHYCLPENYSHE